MTSLKYSDYTLKLRCKRMSYEEPTKGAYYVSMTDRFMSGWGKTEGKTNKLVIACDTYEEALTVRANAESRDEMKYINIRITKPWYDPRYYYVSWADKSCYNNWFKPNAFSH